jgi:PAS domain S-box-containing protein
MGTNISELISQNGERRVNDFYLNQFNERRWDADSFPIITKSRKWVEQTVKQLREGNRITGHKSIMRDITDRHAAEQN